MSAQRPIIRELVRDPAEDLPLSFVVCVSDETVLASNLMASPCLGSNSSHEVIAFRDPSSAAAALNSGLERARHGLVVCVHQDVFLPSGWDRLLVRQYRLAERQFGPIGVAGVYGVGDVISPGSPDGSPAVGRVGHVVDRGRMFAMEEAFPRKSPPSTSCS